MGQKNRKLYKKPGAKYYVKGDGRVERKIKISDVTVKAVALVFYPFYLAVSGTGKLVKGMKAKIKGNTDYTKQTKTTTQFNNTPGKFQQFKSFIGRTFEKVTPFVKKQKWAVAGVAALAVVTGTSAYVLLNAEETPVETAVAPKTHAISAADLQPKSLEEDAAITGQAPSAALAEETVKMPELMVKSAASARVYALAVNGNDIAFFKSEEEANALLETLKKEYAPSAEETGREVVDTFFYEDVTVNEKFVDIMDFEGYDAVEDALTFVKNGSREKRVHVVEKGENYWTIANYYGIAPADLEAANPTIKPERLMIGMEINLVVPKPFITVCTVERATFTDQIPFEVVYEDNSNLFKGEQRTKVNGAYGERVVTAEVTKQNGREISRKTLSEDVKSEPQTKVVYKGTKNPPPRVGSGILIRPVSGGPITSPFGPRGRGRHLGIDIGVRSGTPVKAADGGTVVFAGWGDGYGYHVIIDHGGNMKTVYAHNSKLLVKTGQRVHQGQTVSYSGNTGNSYGAHLHFEVRINGVYKNPANYVNF